MAMHRHYCTKPKKRANGLLAGGRVKMAVIVTPDGERLTHWEGR